MKRKIKIGLTSGLTMAFGHHLPAGTTVQSSINSIGSVTGSSVEASYSEEDSLKDEDKAETEAKIWEMYKDDEDAIILAAASINEDEIVLVRQKKQEPKALINESLIRELNMQLYFWQRLKERALQIQITRLNERLS